MNVSCRKINVFVFGKIRLRHKIKIQIRIYDVVGFDFSAVERYSMRGTPFSFSDRLAITEVSFQSIQFLRIIDGNFIDLDSLPSCQVICQIIISILTRNQRCPAEHHNSGKHTIRKTQSFSYLLNLIMC